MFGNAGLHGGDLCQFALGFRLRLGELGADVLPFGMQLGLKLA